ncbi:3',5'-cyclic-AMP phosphodiesterase [Methylosoma difficile]
MSILQISDLHILAKPEESLQGVNTAYYFQAVLRQAFAELRDVDLLLLTGDLTQYGSLTGYQFILEVLEAYQIPALCLPGNHDYADFMGQVFSGGLVSCEKQRLFGDWQLICLNSQIPGEDCGIIEAEELQFLEACLQAYPEHHALIAVHHPCFKTQSAWLDTMIIKNSQEMLAVVGKYPQVKAVTCGHIHQEMDMPLNGIRLLGTPSTCFQFKPESMTFALDDAMPGYRHLQLFADGRIETSVSRLPGKLTGLSPDIYDH